MRIDGAGAAEKCPNLLWRIMSEKEIAENVLILVSKGYVSDYGDTDYFCDESEEVLDRAYEMMDELQEGGSKAFKAKYGLS